MSLPKGAGCTGEMVFCRVHASTSMLGVSVLKFEKLPTLKLAFENIDIPEGLYVNLLESCDTIDRTGEGVRSLLLP